MDYYLNKNAQSTGEHEVHKGTCNYLPTFSNRIHLGNFYSCTAALSEAKNHYSNVDGCFYCCSECHKK